MSQEVTISTIWQAICPTILPDGLVTSTTRSLPPNFTPAPTASGSLTVPTLTLPIASNAAMHQPAGATALEVSIHTTVTIKVFPTNVAAYQPTYEVTQDGSLITSLFETAEHQQHLWIIITGFLFAIFLRNVITALGYLRRKDVARDKTLFYLLLASQIWGPIALLAVIVGVLNPRASCYAINILTLISMEAASSLLISGILGIKAYRCLYRSRIVLLSIIAFQSASTAIFVFDIRQTRSARSFEGACTPIRTGIGIVVPLYVFILFAETGFLSLCFLVAAWKATQSPAANGRISLAPTPLMPDFEWVAINDQEDYAAADASPEEELASLQTIPNSDTEPTMRTHNRQISWRSKIRGRLGSRSQGLSDDLPQTPAGAVPPVREKMGRGRAPSSATAQGSLRSRLTSRIRDQSSQNPWRKKVPNMLSAVIRSELLSTTAIAITCFISAVTITLVAARDPMFSPLIWLQINWAITSYLVMRSYDRVARRRDEERILQEPIRQAGFGTTRERLGSQQDSDDLSWRVAGSRLSSVDEMSVWRGGRRTISIFSSSVSSAGPNTTVAANPFGDDNSISQQREKEASITAPDFSGYTLQPDEVVVAEGSRHTFGSPRRSRNPFADAPVSPRSLPA